MCEQTAFNYQSGQVVWVKLGSCWWPGEARSYDELPEDAKNSLKKPPVTAVQFFDEDKYEYVRSYDKVCLYNCKRKNEFIQKGLEMLHKHKDENFMNKFPSDVTRAEELTNGDPDIIKTFQSMPDERPDYNTIFGKTPAKSPKKGRSPKGSKRKSMPATKRKIDLNVLMPGNRQPFARRSDSALLQQKSEHKCFIRVQPVSQKEDNKISNMEMDTSTNENTNADANTSTISNTTPEKMFSCFMCDFKTKRIEGFMAHRKSHLSLSYGARRPQIAPLKKSRKKSDGTSTGGKKRSSYPPSAKSQSSANKKRTSLTSKFPKIKAKPEVSKVSSPKLANTVKVSPKKKVVLDEPESLESTSPVKPAVVKKKAPRKRKNEDVFKTQLLADWDDEDPTLLQQEEERIKKKLKASCFDFDDSADSILDTELEERANKFARTRNIPIIPKPESGSKKQRSEDLPSTSRELQSIKRPAEESLKPSKRLKINDQVEEACAKLMLSDEEIPEYEPQWEESSPTIHPKKSLETESKLDDSTEVKSLIECLSDIPLPSSSPGKVVDEPVVVSQQDKSGEDMLPSEVRDDTEVIFCGEEKPPDDKVSESVAELAEGNTHLEDASVKNAELLADLQDDDVRPLATSPRSSPKPDDDDDDDMPEIICVEHRSPRKSALFHGEYTEHGQDTSQAGTGEILDRAEKHADDVERRSPEELEIRSPASVEISDESKEASTEIGVSGTNELCVQSSDSDNRHDDIEENMKRACEGEPYESTESEKAEMTEVDNNEVTIIGYRCSATASTEFKDLDENMLESGISAALLDSPFESSTNSNLLESTTRDSCSATELCSSDSALIKVLEGSADENDDEDDKLENEDRCTREDVSQTKEKDLSSVVVGESSKTDVSRDEIVAEWSDEFDEDNQTAPLAKGKTIEVIDLEKSENESEDMTENDDEISGKHAAIDKVSEKHAAVDEIVSCGDIKSVVTEQEKGEISVASVPVTDVTKDDEMELDINSMPIVVEDAVIKDDVPPSSSRISVVGTSTPVSLSPKTTTTFLLSPAPTTIKTSSNNIIVVSSQSRQLPLTARGVFTSPHGKVVIMPRAAKGKKLAPMLVANSSGLTTRVFTESEQESLFKEGKKTLLQRARPNITIQAPKTKPLLPNIPKTVSTPERPSMKFLKSKSVIVPGTSLMTASPSGITTTLKGDTTAVQGAVPKILVRSSAPKLLLQKNVPNLTPMSSSAGPQGLKRLTNIFPLIKGNANSAKQLVIPQPITKSLTVQAGLQTSPVQVFPKSQLQPLKKTKRMFTSHPVSNSSPTLKSVPTTTIEISMSDVQSVRPSIPPSQTVQRCVNVSTIPRIPSSTIALPGAQVPTTSSLVVENQGSVVFIVDPANISHYNTSTNILDYNTSSQNAAARSVYIEPSSMSKPGSLDNMVITLGNSSGSAITSGVLQLSENSQLSPVLVSNSRSKQDILAKAIADTPIFQPEACLQDTLAVVSNEQSISEATAMLPNLQTVLPTANPSEVLETLTLKEPIMTPHEVPSRVTSIQVQSVAPVSLHASLAASPSMPLLTDDPMLHIRAPSKEVYENSTSQDDIKEEPQVIADDGR